MCGSARLGILVSLLSKEEMRGGCALNEKKEKVVFVLGLLLLVALIVGLRVVSLDSDAYRGLSWDTGLFTDEGYYTHNARNLVLYGTEKTDDFNNNLLMPTIHYVQVGVFKVFGYGAIQARLISVVFSLLTLVIFWLALIRCFDMEVAVLATLILGLDHIHLLYNRMALMDTPAAFVMVCAFFACIRLWEEVSSDAIVGNAGVARWGLIAGGLLGLVYATRGLGAILIPAPFIAYWLTRRQGYALEQKMGFVFSRLVLGIGLVFVVYLLLWYLPHREALAHANRYHVGFQLMPHSPSRLWHNIWQALFGQAFLGLAPYLSRYSPITFFAVLTLFAGWRAVSRLPLLGGFTARLLAVWLGAGWLLFAVVNYAPSRYYILVSPALAGLSAIAIIYIKDVWEEVCSQRVIRSLLFGFMALQLAGMLATRLPNLQTPTIVGITLFGAVIGLLSPSSMGYDRTSLTAMSRASVVLAVSWMLINGYWLCDWWNHRTYTHRDASQWLERNLPPESVLIGDCAPGLGFYNRLKCVNVIPDLCNDQKPYERFSPFPRYIAILDEGYKETWWKEHYPKLVAPERRVILFSPLVSHPVGVYH